MYECPNCGGNLRFDIPTQSLFCDYCHTAESLQLSEGSRRCGDIYL